MFKTMWGPAVHAMGVVLEHADTEPAIRAALDGLRTATRLASHFEVDGVADSAVLALARFSGSLNPALPKARVLLSFGQDHRAQAAVETTFHIVTR